MEPILNYQNPYLSPEAFQKQQENLSKEKEIEAAKDFEAVFVQMTLKEMRPKLEGGMFNAGLAEDVFYQMMDEAIAKSIAHSENNFGIADQLIKQNF